MTRRPNLARACHQLERHGSGTPNDAVPEPTPIGVFLAGLAESTRAAFTGPFWPLGTFPAATRDKQEAA